MTERELKNLYFNWMCSMVCDDRRFFYERLLSFLENTNFTYILPMDANRADDGIELRYRFGREKGYPDAMIASCLDWQPCSVLEMMVALAMRCETSIMDDPDIGDRTVQWFWGMISNLGLGAMDDTRFDRRYVDAVVQRFLNRQYRSDGNGGLFTVHRPDKDLRHVEIWYQMCWYLDELVQEENA